MTLPELRRRLVEYLNVGYPTVVSVSQFVKWSLALIKKTFFGITGIAVLLIAGLYIAGALIEPARWYLVGVASVLLLLCGGLLALARVRFVLSRFVNQHTKQLSNIKTQVSDIKKGTEASNATLAEVTAVVFPPFYRFNRRLTNKDLEHFAGEWVPKLGLDLHARALEYMAHHIRMAEHTCLGRLAGDIEDMLLRILVARSIKEPELSVLEIGTLFGVSVAIIYENCRGFFTDVHITVIDPLQGYYGKPLDPQTMMPVTHDTFVRNLERMHIPQQDYTIIERLSTEDEAIQEASKKRYNVLIIDGDHSYSGVKGDFLNYGPLVKVGGYIVFDNYDDATSPEVTEFVDKEVVGLPELEFVGANGITGVFRVISGKD